MENKHFVCDGGCHGNSDTPGSCNTESCPKYGQPLQECQCSDGQHQATTETETSTDN